MAAKTAAKGKPVIDVHPSVHIPNNYVTPGGKLMQEDIDRAREMMRADKKYRDDFCAAVIAAGARGKSFKWIAAELFVNITTLYRWISEYPEFRQAMEIAGLLSQKWWEDKGQENLETAQFNSAMWSKNISMRFKDWQETKQIEHTGLNGGPIEIEGSIKTITIDQMSERALSAIEEAVEIALITQDEEEDPDA